MQPANIIERLATTLLCLAVFASASFAKTQPLNQPNGLAVASNGDLYVANEGGNQILIYDTSYSQLAGKAITKGVNQPLAVAFDPLGNLWVANVVPKEPGTEYFSEYSPAGKQINAAYANNNTEYDVPALAVDGVGDIWTAQPGDNGQDLIAAYNAPSPYSVGFLTRLYSADGEYTAVAARGPWIAFGTASNASWGLVGTLLSGVQGTGHLGSSEACPGGVNAMTFDANDVLYLAGQNDFGDTYIQSINVAAGATPVISSITLNFVPSALAADSVRGRLYIANPATNQIQVYSTTTFELLTTIQ
jgi:hypothetical protein